MPYGKSPNKMGHKDSAMKMESAKQEKYNLLHDNPVAKHGSWMSKHATPFNMGHESPAKMGHEGSPAKHKLKDATKGTHWHAEDGTIITEKEGKLTGQVKFEDGYKIDLKNITYADGVFKCGLYVDYEYVSIKAKIDGKSLTGAVDSPEGEMKITAKKVK